MAKRLPIFAFVLLAVAATPAFASSMLGFPDKVPNGDTFSLCVGRACKMVHLCGISAPKQGAPEFDKSRIALISALGNNLVSCTTLGSGTPCDDRVHQDNPEPIIAKCSLNGKDVAQIMVDEGLACDQVKESGGAYSKDGKGKACP
jgi:endonuclease YncB( thermonuclease family)